MHRVRLHQPDVAVNTRSFIKPAVALRRIHTNQQNISAAGNHEVGQIKTERIVSPAVSAQVKTVEHHHRLAVCSVKFYCDPFACVFRRKIETRRYQPTLFAG